MIAGSGATLGIWTPDLLKTLAQERQVIIFDNRGIGLSTDSAEAEHTADSYAESTMNLIDALGLTQPDVLGWSMGGFITLAIAVKYADRVHTLVLASTSSGGLLGVLISEQQMLNGSVVHAQCMAELRAQYVTAMVLVCKQHYHHGFITHDQSCSVDSAQSS